LVALVTMGRALVLAAGLGWIVYQAPHLIYHLRHLDVYDTTDQALNVTSLVLALALPLAVVVLAPRLGRTTAPVQHQPAR
jgi:hypothetical protein